VLDSIEGGTIQSVVNDASDLVALVRHDGMVAQIVQRKIRQHHLGRDPFALGARGETCHLVAGAQFVGFTQHLLDRAETVVFAEQTRGQVHSVQ